MLRSRVVMVRVAQSSSTTSCRKRSKVSSMHLYHWVLKASVSQIATVIRRSKNTREWREISNIRHQSRVVTRALRANMPLHSHLRVVYLQIRSIQVSTTTPTNRLEEV